MLVPEEVNRVLTSAPFIASLGIRLDFIGRGECRTVLPLAHQHLQQDGFVHAGVQATMADHTAGAAAASLVAKGQLVLTVEFKINFLRSAKGSRLLCRSKVLKSGAQLTVVESEVLCGAPGKERLVSKATVTLAIVASRAG